MEPQGPDKRQLVTLLVVSLLFGGGYMAYVAFTSPDDSGEERALPNDEDQSVPDQRDHGDGQGSGTVPAQAPASEERIAIEGDGFRALVSNVNTGLASLELTTERWADQDGSTKQMVTTEKPAYYPLRAELGGVNMPEDAVWEVDRREDGSVRLTWEGNGFRVARELAAGEGPYQLWSTIAITNTSAGSRPVRVRLKTYHYVEREDEEGGFFAAQSPAISHGICVFGDEVERVDREDAVEGRGYGQDVRLAGIENQYFANVMAIDGAAGERCSIRGSDRGNPEAVGTLFETTLTYPRQEIAAGETHVIRTLAYLGPKDTGALATAGHGLRVVVDRGWFSAVAEWLVALLGIIFGFVGNWGLAIILMTVLVRIALFPLTWKSFQSMAKMRVLKPEMDRITQLYKDDPQKKGAAMMEMYRKEKINPLGGCLPSLLQMPVWFAFYASLSSNTELYHAEFALWYTDLSAPDPYFVLPILVGGLMFVQQKITPTAMDPTQAKIMLYFMPIMITSFLLFLPSGLCLYMVTNSVLGIGQQQWIHRSLMKHEKKPGELAPDVKSESKRGDFAASAKDGDGGGDGSGDGAGSAEPPRSASVISVRRPKPRGKAAKRRTRRAR
jgi:YidC/Oxa1 family membrane protein insertase